MEQSGMGSGFWAEANNYALAKSSEGAPNALIVSAFKLYCPCIIRKGSFPQLAFLIQHSACYAISGYPRKASGTAITGIKALTTERCGGGRKTSNSLIASFFCALPDTCSTRDVQMWLDRMQSQLRSEVGCEPCKSFAKSLWSKLVSWDMSLNIPYLLGTPSTSTRAITPAHWESVLRALIQAVLGHSG